MRAYMFRIECKEQGARRGGRAKVVSEMQGDNFLACSAWAGGVTETRGE